MLTKILVTIIFGFGGWFLSVNYPSVTSESQNIQYYLWVLFIMCGVGAGFVVGHGLAIYLAKFLSYRYEMSEKNILSPFLYLELNTLDKEILLVKDSKANILYCHHGTTMFARKEDILSVKVESGIDTGYWAISLPTRISIFGLFGDFSTMGPKWSFVVPSTTTIKEGEIIKVISHYQLKNS